MINAVARLCLRSTSNRLRKIVTECSDDKNCIQNSKRFLESVSKALATHESHGLDIDNDDYFQIHGVWWRAKYAHEFESETTIFHLKNSN